MFFASTHIDSVFQALDDNKWQNVFFTLNQGYDIYQVLSKALFLNTFSLFF